MRVILSVEFSRERYQFRSPIIPFILSQCRQPKAGGYAPTASPRVIQS